MTSNFFRINGSAFVIAFAILLALLFAWRWRSHFLEPSLYFSRPEGLLLPRKTARLWMAQISDRLPLFALGCFLLAFIDPHFQQLKPMAPEESNEGIAIYLVVDRSGSMADRVDTPLGKIPKIEFLKAITKKFVQGRPQDLIGLVAFARTPQVLVPLTIDHDMVMKELAGLHVVTSIDQDSTAIGYAIYKVANVITATRNYVQGFSGDRQAPYEIKNAIIILLTDGFQAVHPLDKDNPLRSMSLQEAAEAAKGMHVKVYVVNVDPTVASEEFAPHRHQMQMITQLTGGRFYLAEDPADLGNIFNDIDKLEKSAIPSSATKEETMQRGFSFAPILMFLGMLALISALLLNSTLLRRLP